MAIIGTSSLVSLCCVIYTEIVWHNTIRWEHYVVVKKLWWPKNIAASLSWMQQKQWTKPNPMFGCSTLEAISQVRKLFAISMANKSNINIK